MLSRLEFVNYRGFKSYKMEGLTQVTLLVGKNNSGKTSILEGIHFLTSKGDPAVLEDICRRRGEMIVRRRGDLIGHEELAPSTEIAHLFHGHAITPDTACSFSGGNEYSPVKVAIYQRTKHKKEDTLETDVSRSRTSSPTGLHLKISHPDREEILFRVARDGGIDLETGPRFRRSSVRLPAQSQVRFVGPDSLSSLDVASMWDEITVNRKERDVADAMRIIDPRVESIQLLTAVFAGGYFPARGGIVVGVEGQSTRSPLGSMGDGMRRVMALAVALASAKNGCLLVDELDTGLHYSVMQDMWRLVIERAIESNVQVVATTHSWDCIEGLSSACQSDPTLMSHVSIHKIDQAIPHSVRFSGESIVKMVKSDIDPR